MSAAPELVLVHDVDLYGHDHDGGESDTEREPDRRLMADRSDESAHS